MMKISTATLVSTLVLGLAFWYAYWWSAGEAPTAEETMLLVGIAAAISAGAVALRARMRRSAQKEAGDAPSETS
jgi:hypothetical protein